MTSGWTEGPKHGFLPSSTSVVEQQVEQQEKGSYLRKHEHTSVEFYLRRPRWHYPHVFDDTIKGSSATNALDGIPEAIIYQGMGN